MCVIVEKIGFMNPNYKRQVRQGALLATGDHEKKFLAEVAGCARQTFSTFINGGNLGDEYLERLAGWLKDNDYWPVRKSVDAEGLEMLIRRIRLVLEVLESPDTPTTLKAKEFLNFLDAGRDWVAVLERLIQK